MCVCERAFLLRRRTSRSRSIEAICQVVPPAPYVLVSAVQSATVVKSRAGGDEAGGYERLATSGRRGYCSVALRTSVRPSLCSSLASAMLSQCVCCPRASPLGTRARSFRCSVCLSVRPSVRNVRCVTTNSLFGLGTRCGAGCLRHRRRRPRHGRVSILSRYRSLLLPPSLPPSSPSSVAGSGTRNLGLSFRSPVDPSCWAARPPARRPPAEG